MKADDDTYVILENLRFLLSDYNTSDPIWFGCEFDVIVKEGYMSGGAGYVLSKGIKLTIYCQSKRSWSSSILNPFLLGNLFELS